MSRFRSAIEWLMKNAPCVLIMCASAMLTALVLSCSVALKKADEVAGEKLVEKVEAEAPELAEKIREDAEAAEAAGSTTPFFDAIRLSWKEIALVLGFGGGGLGILRQWRKGSKVKALFGILSRGLEAAKPLLGDERVATVKDEIANRMAASEFGGSLRAEAEALGIEVARTRPK